MKLSLLSFAFISFLFDQCQSNQQHRQLIFVQTVFRHGDRAPSSIYVNDPYKNISHYWPRGLQQLTNILFNFEITDLLQLGMRQAYELGQFFRQRYIVEKIFLSKHYDLKHVAIRSSDSKRALTSAQAMITGMYPPNDWEVWHRNFANWQPIAVHANSPDTDDLLLKPTSVDCPTYDQIVERENAPLKSQINRDYVDFFKFVAKNSGYSKIDYDSIDRIYASAYPEHCHNLSQPAWIDEYWPKYNATTYEIICELKRIIRIADFNSRDKSKFRSGYLLGDLVGRMRHKIDGKLKSPTKMQIYSAVRDYLKNIIYQNSFKKIHDGTVLPLMYSIGISNNYMIPYSAALIFELYQITADNNHYHYEVEILYRNSTNFPPFQLLIPNCTTTHGRCRLNLFEKLVSSQIFNTSKQFYDACGIHNQSLTSAASLKFSTTAIIITLLLIIFLMCNNV